MLEGRYGYRFSGFSMKGGCTFYLVGLGVLDLTADGNVAGHQSSTMTQVVTVQASLERGRYILSGTYAPGHDGVWEATIKFVSEETGPSGEPVQVLEGTFDFVPTTGDRLLLISTGAYNVTEGAPTDEVMSGEAYRMVQPVRTGVKG